MGPPKLRNRVLLGKCSKWSLHFQNWSKALCLGVSESTKGLALRNRQGEWAFVKYNEKQ